MPVEVSSAMVRRVVETMDKCDQRDVQLSENAMQNINDLFLKVCRLALTGPTLSSLSLPSCSISQSPSHTSLKSSLPPPSPSQTKRRKKQKFVSLFLVTLPVMVSVTVPQKQGSYNVQKATLTESLGSGRHIPLKESLVKKKSSGMRLEWKKKYLVLSETELTYYPSLTVSLSLPLMAPTSLPLHRTTCSRLMGRTLISSISPSKSLISVSLSPGQRRHLRVGWVGQ